MKNHSLPLILLLLLVGGSLAGCGADDDKIVSLPHNNPPLSNEPPANEPPVNQPPAQEPPVEEPPVEEPPVEEPPAAEPVAALVLDADIAANGVAPHGSIVLISDRALDAASVETSLELRDASTTETLRAEIEYRAEEQEITITPAGKFAENRHYAVHLKGARDTEGNTVVIAGQSVVKVKRRLYSRTTVYNQDGNITNVSIFMPLPGTNEARSTSYTSPGMDGNWLETADNAVGSYSLFQYLPDGIEIKKVYSGPGEGGIWFDDNDAFERAYYTRRNDAGQVVQKLHSTNAGPDAELFTNDDDYVSAHCAEYDGDGKLVRYFWAFEYQHESRLNAGPDGEWMTGDDPIINYHERFYDDAGRLRHDYRYVHPGVDGRWFTTNDLVSGIDAYEYDASGELSRYIRYAGAFDGVLDGNDYLTGYYDYRVVGNARVRERYIVYGPDIDAPSVYLDDYRYETYDEHARPTAWGFFGSEGGDGAWHTPDDVMQNRAGGVYSYQTGENGVAEQHEIFLVDNGENGTRFDGDELVDFYYVRGYDETSQITRLRLYQPVDGPAFIEEGNFRLYFETEYLDVTVE